MKIEDYTLGDAFQAEKRTIFSTTWLPLCAEGQLPKRGDYLSSSVGGWGVVAVRDRDSTVHVLRNACRHQNMPVVNSGTGNCANFRCRFHGWTYGLDGRFVSAPPPMAPPPTQTDRDLLLLAMASTSGLLFFSMGQQAGQPQLEDLPAYGGTSTMDIDCNWKVCAEHFLGDSGDFVWPLLFVRRDGASAIVRQIVPHTFLRTRLFTHVFGGAATASETEVKKACEALQVERAAGTMPADSDFHRRLAQAYAGSS
jgi:phenylpropionate dioxygenase-like ring-hydroxylating dioxygenase large terminal subunit